MSQNILTEQESCQLFRTIPSQGSATDIQIVTLKMSSNIDHISNWCLCD
jgi:hypothetical protein